MKEYFKRLKNHPGVEVAGFMSILIPMAALSNKNLDNYGVIVISGFGILFMWTIVLLTNYKR